MGVDLKSQEAKDGREKAQCRLKVLAAVTAIACSVLFILAVVAATKYPNAGSSPPYFIGGFVVGPLGILQTIACVCLVIRGPNAASDDTTKRRQLGCAWMSHSILSLFLIMACFLGVILATFGGLNFPFGEEVPAKPKALATCILVGCLLVLVVSIVGMCISCNYGAYFGVVRARRRRRQAFVLASQQGNTGGNNDEYVRNVEEQNRLLQEQIQLQQQLLNQQHQLQQQQQQQQSGFQLHPSATAPQEPVPVFNSQPDTPPPSYDKVAL